MRSIFCWALINLYGMFVDQSFFSSNMPYAADAFVLRAFVEGWSPFAFEVIGIGSFLLWASRDARKFAATVWLIAWLEIWHGVIDDLYLISQGYSAGGYLAFIAVHLLIAGLGIYFVRQLPDAG